MIAMVRASLRTHMNPRNRMVVQPIRRVTLRCSDLSREIESLDLRRQDCVAHDWYAKASYEVRVEPPQVRLEASDPVFRLSHPREIVILLREEDQLGLFAVVLQGGEELDRLDVPATQVLERVHEQEGRRHVLDVPERRLRQRGLLV